MSKITANQFKRQFSVELLQYQRRRKNDDSLFDFFEVKVTNKKTGISDIYTFDNWCGEAEPSKGIFNNLFIGVYIINFCHKKYIK